MDQERVFYEFLGNRKLSLMPALRNPLRAYRGFKEMNARIKDKNVEGNMVCGRARSIVTAPLPSTIYTC